MDPAENYLEINRQSWNQRTEVHLDSEFYDVESFLKGRSSLNEIELNLLEDIQGKSILHLQCHFGQDTISLARMGAEVTGVDLSDKAIENAKKLAEKAGVEARFIRSDLYDLPNHLEGQFDIVFTTYGTIGWLPDLDKWAQVIAHFLKSGGQFIFAEFHPALLMFDDHFQGIGYNYFKDGAIVETETGSYTDRSAPITHQNVSWNHSLSEVFTNLLQNGLEIQVFREFDYSPYDCFNGTTAAGPNRFRIGHLGSKIPMVYALRAVKKQ